MTWLKDTAERVVRTFVQAWLGAWLAISGHGFDDLVESDVLLVGFSASVAALLTCLAATQIGNKNDASLRGGGDKGMTFLQGVVLALVVLFILFLLGLFRRQP